MDHTTKIISTLWDLTKNKKYFAVNIFSKENEIIVSILTGNRWKRFKNKDTEKLINEIKHSALLI